MAIKRGRIPVVESCEIDKEIINHTNEISQALNKNEFDGKCK